MNPLIAIVIFLVMQACALSALGAGTTQSTGTYSLGAAVFERVRPSVVVLRTAIAGTEHNQSNGSAFLVDANAMAITNYHVVASYLLNPNKFSLTYQTPENEKGKATVIAIDVLHDLAVVALNGLSNRGRAYIPLPNQVIRPALGDAVFAIGNPLDLGVTITSGSYSGVIKGSFNSQIHFTGAVNAGMSGGPAVDRAGKLIGVNVARALGSDSVSFLVPAEHATRLYKAANRNPPLKPSLVRKTIAQQLLKRQQQINDLAFSVKWKNEAMGPYQVPLFMSEHTNCSAGSNESDKMPPYIRQLTNFCSLITSVMPAPEVRSGTLAYRHSLFTSQDANEFQLASAANSRFFAGLITARSESMARQNCSDHFTQAGVQKRIPVRMVWCAQAYRDFPDVYDIQIAIATQDRRDTMLVSRMSLEGVSWQTAQGFTRRLLVGIQ